MFKKGLKWLVKATTKKEDAKETKRFDGYHVYSWNQETHNVKLIDKFETKDIVVMDPDGKIVEML